MFGFLYTMLLLKLLYFSCVFFKLYISMFIAVLSWTWEDYMNKLFYLSAYGNVWCIGLWFYLFCVSAISDGYLNVFSPFFKKNPDWYPSLVDSGTIQSTRALDTRVPICVGNFFSSKLVPFFETIIDF